MRATGSRYCLLCKAAYMRQWRKTHRLAGEAKRRDTARHIAGVYLRRGKLTRGPCEVCGELAEMHHDDYSKPLAVRWLCREHHLQHHNM